MKAVIALSFVAFLIVSIVIAGRERRPNYSVGHVFDLPNAQNLVGVADAQSRTEIARINADSLRYVADLVASQSGGVNAWLVFGLVALVAALAGLFLWLQHRNHAATVAALAGQGAQTKQPPLLPGWTVEKYNQLQDRAAKHGAKLVVIGGEYRVMLPDKSQYVALLEAD